MTIAPFLDDLMKLRACTREHCAEGIAAVGDVVHRDTVLRLLNDVLASELIWLMRYRRSFLLRRMPPHGSAPTSHEPTPADRLALRIVELGGIPDLDPDHLLAKNRADYASSGTLAERVREDLRAERIVIESYRAVLDFLGAADPTTRAVLESNLDRERERATRLAQILLDLEGQTLEAVG